jgi:hypothetical protein
MRNCPRCNYEIGGRGKSCPRCGEALSSGTTELLQSPAVTPVRNATDVPSGGEKPPTTGPTTAPVHAHQQDTAHKDDRAALPPSPLPPDKVKSKEASPEHAVSSDDRPLPMPEDSSTPHTEGKVAAANPRHAGGIDPPSVTFLGRNAARDPGAEGSPQAERVRPYTGEGVLKRFTPGQLINRRYSIVARIGEGAMGEVYRAEDKRLGGDVALKFLPAHAAADADSLKRLLIEAKLARQVTHPNVCRVFDIDEVDGQTFISMEFIDGETISSLLRRIGRLPEDKALHVAHQICAGLAWAHERGILHRDLKPANVMLDGAGEVRIADFGLSDFIDVASSDGRRAGTPAYMAPETLRGRGSSARSDIFSLGLVLYEVFTGKPVYRPVSISQLEAMHDLPIPPISTIVPGIDPLIDSAVMACLEREPALRPASVRNVIERLPGGNTLAAALRAGQTPSPRQVAAAGGDVPISGAHLAYLLAAMIAALAIALGVGKFSSLLERVPLRKSAQVLASTSEDIIERLGYSVQTPYRAYGFDFYDEYINLIKQKDESFARWDRLMLPRPSAIDFWYRQSPRPLTTQGPHQKVTFSDPAFEVGGMINIRLDPRGRLREFTYYTPAESDAVTHSSSADAQAWESIFDLAGLGYEHFAPAPNERVPPVFADERFTWVGAYPDAPAEKIRVEAALLAGKPVAFRIVELNWVEASVFQPENASVWLKAGRGMNLLVESLATVAVVWLGLRNLRQRIGDKVGATRLSTYVFVTMFLGIWLSADHPKQFTGELLFIVRAIQLTVPTALWFWIAYIAIEPFARRIWPETLISWSRFIHGDILNPLCGIHAAWGCVAGAACAALAYAHRLSASWIGYPPSLPWIDPERGVTPLQGPLVAVGTLFDLMPYAAKFTMMLLVILLLTQLVIGKRWIAATVYATIQTVIWMLLRGDSPLSWLYVGAVASICTIVAVRAGFLGAAFGVLVFETLVVFAPTVQPGSFWMPTAMTAVLGVIALFIVCVASAVGAFRRPEGGLLASASAV